MLDIDIFFGLFAQLVPRKFDRKQILNIILFGVCDLNITLDADTQLSMALDNDESRSTYEISVHSIRWCIVCLVLVGL